MAKNFSNQILVSSKLIISFFRKNKKIYSIGVFFSTGLWFTNFLFLNLKSQRKTYQLKFRIINRLKSVFIKIGAQIEKDICEICGILNW